MLKQSLCPTLGQIHQTTSNIVMEGKFISTDVFKTIFILKSNLKCFLKRKKDVLPNLARYTKTFVSQEITFFFLQKV